MLNHEAELQETVVHINRVAKVVKGGKNFSFSAVVVAGDGAGKVGFGTGKAREVPPAIQKASDRAKREMIAIPLVGGTVPHLVWGRHGATKVLLRPASPGTGVIAGGGVRAVMESAGVQDVLTKVVGSRNPFNVVRATFNAITLLMTQDRVRRLRGIDVMAPAADAKVAGGDDAAPAESPTAEAAAPATAPAAPSKAAAAKSAAAPKTATAEPAATEAKPKTAAKSKPKAEVATTETAAAAEATAAEPAADGDTAAADGTEDERT